MLAAPIEFEPEISENQYARVGRLIVKWALIDHLIGTCINVQNGTTDEAAQRAVFSETAGRKIAMLEDAMRTLAPGDARRAFEVLLPLWKGLKEARDNVAHGVATINEDRNVALHHRRKSRDAEIEEILSLEEVTNFVAHAALSLRYALGLKSDPNLRHSLPAIPPIPDLLTKYMN